MMAVQYGQIPAKWDSCVIWNKWRRVRGEELYDLKTDPAQESNKANMNPEVFEKMRAHYEAWWGKVARERPGLSFSYFSPDSAIVSVPLASANIPFVFNEPTVDFQTIAVQGQMTYRIVDAKKAAAMLDFTVDAKGKYLTDQHLKLPERLVYGLQTLVRVQFQNLRLREALVHGDILTVQVLDQLKTSPEVSQLGVEILNLAVLSLKPTPEMAKALEAFCFSRAIWFSISLS